MIESGKNKVIVKSPAKLISEITGYSDSYISLVLSGERHNDKILNVANDIIELQKILILKHSSKIK